jgi:hypothetical protein
MDTLVGYAESTRRSLTGYVFMLAGAAINWTRGNTRKEIQEEIDAMWNNITEWLSYALKNSCGMLGRFRHHQGMFWTPELTAESNQLNAVINEISTNTAGQDGTLRLEKKILFKR